MPFTSNGPSIFDFTVVAAIVTTFGTLLGYVIRELLLVRSFETWKARREAEQIFRRYRDPIVLAASDLANRLLEICSEYPTDYLASKVLAAKRPSPSRRGVRDLYFRRYKLQSTAYRMAAFLAWLELYRQDLVFLDTGHSRTNKKLDSILREIRESLADGQLNKAPDWQQWTDRLVFREEQRAIGEKLILQQGQNRAIMGYGNFIALLDAKNAEEDNHWIRLTVDFFVDPDPPKDFRLTRYHMLIVKLVDLIALLRPNLLHSALLSAVKDFRPLVAKSSSTE